jgi:alpha-tubulin suppressor-like RCC1 family protein
MASRGCYLLTAVFLLSCADLDALRSRAGKPSANPKGAMDAAVDGASNPSLSAGSSGTGGAGGTDGANGTGRTNGTGGTSSNNGAGGTSGTSGASGASGTGGTGGMGGTEPPPCSTQTYYADQDGDGYGDDHTTMQACDKPNGYVTIGGDCDDACKACHTGGTEACDGKLDENCDGSIDEGCACPAGTSRNCGSNVGTCQYGTQACDAGVWGSCVGGTGPVDEICDGLNNDCDGATDEGLTRTCGTDQGQCVAGTQTCVAGDWGSTCPGETPPASEICDELDNNCDTYVDEPFTNKGTSCTVGVGECQRTGVYVCNSAHDGTSCNASAGTPVTEICGNAKDDDCDGASDESPQTPSDCSACGASCAGSLACNSGACAQAAASLKLEYNESCALLGSPDGNGAYPLSCWGNNANNQLRTGGGNRAQPGIVAVGNVRDVAVGYDYMCDLDDTTDTIMCWGKNNSHQLGTDDTTVTENTFTHSGTVAISAGYQQACLLTMSGQVHCWGDLFNVRSDVAYPTRQMSLATTAAEIAAGSPLACARLTNGQVQCWGVAYGDNGYTAHTVVDGSSAVLTNVTRIVARAATGAPAAHACALRQNGEVWCWGYNYNGEIGNGSSGGVTFEAATKVSSISNAIDVSVGVNDSCALVSGGQVYCWGASKAATGSGSGAVTSPQAIAGLSDAIDIETGWSHSCARRVSGQVSCWGTNFVGELGDGTTIDRTTVRDVLTLP